MRRRWSIEPDDLFPKLRARIKLAGRTVANDVPRDVAEHLVAAATAIDAMAVACGRPKTKRGFDKGGEVA